MCGCRFHICTNNAIESSVQNMDIPSFVRKGKGSQDEPFEERYAKRTLKRKGQHGLKEASRHSKQHLLALKDKAETGRRKYCGFSFGIHAANAILMIKKSRNKTAKAAWYDFTHRIRRGHRTSSGTSCICRIEVCEKTRKNDNKNGI